MLSERDFNKIDKETMECRRQIESILRSTPSMAIKGFGVFDSDIPVAAYLLSKVAVYHNPFGMSYQDVISELDPDIADYADQNGIADLWAELLPLVMNYSIDTFKSVVLTEQINDPYKTPDSLIELSKRLLEIDNGDSIVDLCCGSGSFAFSSREDVPEANIYGFDIHSGAIAYAKMLDDVNQSGINFEKKNVFDIEISKGKKEKKSKIFSNYPFGTGLKNMISGKEYLDQIEFRIPSMSKATSSDWLFNILMIDMLSENGKAVAIMTNGSTWNRLDTPVRKYFVENGLIESVISLPAKLFSYTAIPVTLVVFSHNNSGVRLVDASDLYESGRRFNELTGEHINKILAALEEDSELSIYIDNDQLRDNDYVLSISRYKDIPDSVDNGVAFETVIKRITRGASLNASKLDEISSTVPTGMQYLMLANIHDGLIDKELSYITKIEKKDEKYCLTNHCVILSKNGYPYKVAVAEIKDGQKILANGNLYLIELDEDKIDPYYIAAFFGSELGIASLKRISVGSVMPNIGVEQLKKMIIPVPSLEEQRRIAQKYQALKDEVTLLQLKLERTRSKMAHVFEEGSED